MRFLAAAVALTPLCGCDLVSGLNDFVVPESAPDAGGAGGVAGAGGSEGGGGQGGEGGTPIPTTCDEVEGGTGVHRIDPDGEGGNDPFDAYCEQMLAGGGWTLVGRSAGGGGGSFGWQVDTGSVTDGTNPYSLNALRAGITFTEILIVARGQDPQAFVIDSVPRDFIVAYADDAWDTGGNLTTVLGDCDQAPGMLGFLGHTDRTDVYYARDYPEEVAVFGLFASGWNLNGEDDCPYEGDLSNQAGEIYVR